MECRRGVFFFLAKSIGLTDLKTTTDGEGRLVLYDFRVQNQLWRVLCIYAPNAINEREAFFRQLEDYLKVR